MAILLKNGMLFLHVPKTGGNWVASLLEQNDLISIKSGEKHANIDRLEMINKKMCNKRRQTFCFVRNPITWYESWFKYMTALNWIKWGNEKYHPCAPLDDLGSIDFNKFMENIIDKQPGYLSKLYKSYAKDCDYIGRFEYLQNDLITFLELDGFINPEPQNVSPGINIEWDKNVLLMLYSIENHAFINYGYSI